MSETPGPGTGDDEYVPMDALGEAPLGEQDSSHQPCEDREDPSSWEDPAIREPWEDPPEVAPTEGDVDPGVDR